MLWIPLGTNTLWVHDGRGLAQFFGVGRSDLEKKLTPKIGA